LATDDIEAQLLKYIAEEFGDDLNIFLAESVAADALRLLDELQEARILELVPTRMFLRVALLTAALYRIPFVEAIAVGLAEDSGSPLLVADEATYRTLKALEPARTNFRVAWLSDQLDS